MKSLFLISLFFVNNALSAKEKKFTQKEMDDYVKKEVERQVDLIKKKSVAQLTKELLEKDRKLIEQEKALDHRLEQVKKSEMSLLKKIDELEQAEKKLIGCVDDAKAGETMRVTQLVKVISNMKPQKAAELLSVQESKISIKIIEKIDPMKASKIFNLMDKEVSARLQKQYLNMRQ